MLTPQAIEDLKGFLDNNIAYAKVTVNEEVKKIPIHRRERLKDGRVAVYLNITPQAGTEATIQRVQLYNKINSCGQTKRRISSFPMFRKGRYTVLSSDL